MWSNSGERRGDRMKRIIEVIKMQDQRSEWRQQYDALLQGKIDRLKALSPETREQLRRKFPNCGWRFAGRWLRLLGAFAPKGEVDPQLLKYQAATSRTANGQAGAPQPEPPLGSPFARAIAAIVSVPVPSVHSAAAQARPDQTPGPPPRRTEAGRNPTRLAGRATGAPRVPRRSRLREDPRTARRASPW
jgi:hypothetical protein